jgi:hypothetical protein
MSVVNDLFTNVDRRPEAIQGALDDVDGAIDTGTPAARRREEYAL